MKYLLGIGLFCLFLAGCCGPEVENNTFGTHNNSQDSQQLATTKATYKFPFKVDIETDVNDFLVAVKEESNVITDLYTDDSIKGQKVLFMDEYNFKERYPIQVYILYSFLIQLPEINPEDVITTIKDNEGYYHDAILNNYSRYYHSVVRHLIPDAYYKKYGSEKENMEAVFFKYKDMFLEELNTQLSKEKIKELENQLSSIYRNDQIARKKAFLTKYESYIKILYAKALLPLVVKSEFGTMTSCNRDYWNTYELFEAIYNIANVNRVSPYTLIFGTDYETRNVYIDAEVREVLLKIKIILSFLR